jgi:hypothetical protein
MSHLRELLPSQKVKVNPAAKMEEKWFLLSDGSDYIDKPNPTSHNSHKLCEVWTVGTRKIQRVLSTWQILRYFADQNLHDKHFPTSSVLRRPNPFPMSWPGSWLWGARPLLPLCKWRRDCPSQTR